MSHKHPRISYLNGSGRFFAPKPSPNLISGLFAKISRILHTRLPFNFRFMWGSRILIDMWRMRQFLRLLRSYPYRKGAQQFEKFEFAEKGIEQKKFESTLLFNTNFQGDWKFDLHGLRHGPTSVTDKGQNMAQQRMLRISKIIEKCRVKGYLDPKYPDRLKMTYDGFSFSNFWCMGFANELFKEWGPLWSFLVGLPFWGLIALGVKISWDYLVNV